MPRDHAPVMFADRRAVGLPRRPEAPAAVGDTRKGRLAFITLGCAACHFLPDADRAGQPDFGRTAFAGLADRFALAELAAFLQNPAARYPDGRMPTLPMTEPQARDMAAFLLAWSRPSPPEDPVPAIPLQRSLRCAACHAGVEPAGVDEVPIRDVTAGCMGGRTLPRFTLDEPTRRALAAYLAVAPLERHASPFFARRRLLERLGCVRCHARDDDAPAPLEQVGATLGGAFLQRLPYQRAPRLTDAHTKYKPEFLVESIRTGARGARTPEYTYRMPAYGDRAQEIVRALAEGEGAVDVPEPAAPDPTLAGVGRTLAGFGGYSCVSCHVWAGRELTEVAPGSEGPDLNGAGRRVRRAWFDRWVEDPVRLHPGTPMPSIFRRGAPAPIASILDGDAGRQRDALFAYLSLGKDAPPPTPYPPTPVPPRDGLRVAQIPVRIGGDPIEAIVLQTRTNDLIVYDLAARAPRAAFAGAHLKRTVSGRVRGYRIDAAPLPDLPTDARRSGDFLGYDRLEDGVRLRWSDGDETLRLVGRDLVREPGATFRLPPPTDPPVLEPALLVEAAATEGSLERPGYRAVELSKGLMPSAVAADPKSGRVFVASMKRGDLFVVEGDTVREYVDGLFEEAYSMTHDGKDLYVLHRRNLTRIREGGSFDRVAALPHSVAEAYDYGYGLVREPNGSFVMSFAPYAKRGLPGSGGAVRWLAAGGFEEIAYGMRNPLGWCAGPDGGIYYTDNQGEWVAANKLCHVVPGRYYGFPNPEQKQHVGKPRGRTAVWVPYGWARSINGVTYDDTGGKFGPFAGQFFLAELMYGGAIIRASVETVNGEVQGACFPFWGPGFVGPLVLDFDPAGRLFVGGITEPGWMSQPDRGALFRIERVGPEPFEIRTIRARPGGFHLSFTLMADEASLDDPASYRVEHYRYETTGAYGSPELDRTRVTVRRVKGSPDRMGVELTLDPLVADRVYRISAPGVRAARGGALVHPEGAYTLNEIPVR